MERAEAIKIIKTATVYTPEEMEALETLIPELKESEDERARKGLINFLNQPSIADKITFEAKILWLEYLEKQKEQKPAEWSEDWREEDIQTRFAFYTYKDDPSVLYLSNVFVEETSRNHGFGTRILRAAEKVAETIGATTISLKVKQDSPANAWYRENGYGYVAFEDGYDWLEKNLEYMKPKKSEGIMDEFTQNIRNLITNKLTIHTKGLDGSEVSSTVSIDDKTAKDIASGILFYVGKEATKNPNREIPEWSEEDELKMNALLKYLNPDVGGTKYSSYAQLTEWYNWLKSLRPQPKQVWTEEDDRICHLIMANLSESARHAITLPMETVNDFNNWLRTLQCMPPVFTDWNEEDQTLLSDALGCVTMVQELKKQGKLKNFHISCSYDELRSWVRSLKSRPRKQPSWKPSKEQIETLERWLLDNKYKGDSKYVYPIFESLYVDLKNLRVKG